MRVYIIGNDGITLCREVPEAINDGETAVASKEELHAARLRAGGCCNYGMLCPGSTSARKLATARRCSTTCGRQLKHCPNRTRSRNQTRSARQSSKR
jgi:hypothetical protein